MLLERARFEDFIPQKAKNGSPGDAVTTPKCGRHDTVMTPLSVSGDVITVTSLRAAPGQRVNVTILLRPRLRDFD